MTKACYREAFRVQCVILGGDLFCKELEKTIILEKTDENREEELKNEMLDILFQFDVSHSRAFKQERKLHPVN